MMFKLVVCVVMVSAMTGDSQMDERMVADADMDLQGGGAGGASNSGVVNESVYMTIHADGTIDKTKTKITADMTKTSKMTHAELLEMVQRVENEKDNLIIEKDALIKEKNDLIKAKNELVGETQSCENFKIEMRDARDLLAAALKIEKASLEYKKKRSLVAFAERLTTELEQSHAKYKALQAKVVEMETDFKETLSSIKSSK